MTDLRPIPTRYAGHHFRSRLEARWAVAFDAMGVAWHYEREAFSLPGGTGYLPDFYLPELRLWVEVKPAGGDVSKLDAFAAGLVGTGERATVLNQIPGPSFCGTYGAADLAPACYITAAGAPDLHLDAPYLFCICERCGRVGFTFEGRPRRIGCCETDGSDREGRGGRHPIILAAFDAARCARFEPGQHSNSGAFRAAGEAIQPYVRRALRDPMAPKPTRRAMQDIRKGRDR